MPNMLTVLGIFVAVIIAVVACYLNILLTNQAKEAVILSAKHPVQVVVFLYFLMGHVMLSVIFFLMYLISKLTTFRLASYCHKFETTEGSDEEKRESEMRCDCRECKEKKNCGPLPRLWKRYPYFVGYNSAFLIIYVVIFFCAA